MKNIHPTAIIDPGARLGKDVSVGPYSIIDDDVIIGDHCQISAYVNILPGARIGKECKIFQHAVIGEIPQDLKFHGEESTAEGEKCQYGSPAWFFSTSKYSCYT